MDKNYRIIIEALKQCVFSKEDPNSIIIILEFVTEGIKITTTNTKTKEKKVEIVSL